jgi:hypothetical protein
MEGSPWPARPRWWRPQLRQPLKGPVSQPPEEGRHNGHSRRCARPCTPRPSCTPHVRPVSRPSPARLRLRQALPGPACANVSSSSVQCTPWLSASTPVVMAPMHGTPSSLQCEATTLQPEDGACDANRNRGVARMRQSHRAPPTAGARATGAGRANHPGNFKWLTQMVGYPGLDGYGQCITVSILATRFRGPLSGARTPHRVSSERLAAAVTRRRRSGGRVRVFYRRCPWLRRGVCGRWVLDRRDSGRRQRDGRGSGG